MTHPFKRTVLILVAGGALCAYAGASQAQLSPNFPTRLDQIPGTRAQAQLRPNFPTRLDQLPGAKAEPAPPAAEAPTATAPESTRQPAPRAMAVESRALAPLPPAARRLQQPAEDPAPEIRTTTTRSVTGRVVDVAGRARTYEVKRGDTLEKIADRLDTTVAQLRRDNDIKGSTIHPGDELKGPAVTAKAYVVGSGDTLSSVGRRFGVTVEALREENDLSRNAPIRAGQRLRLPSGYRDRGPIVTTTRTPGAATPPATTPSRGRPAPTPEPEDEAPPERGTPTRLVTGRVIEVDGPPQTYTVRSGDTLEGIARKLDTSVAALRKDNNVKGSNIRPGQKLKGPATTAKAYVAVSGDSLATIARRFGVSAEALRSTNGLNRNAPIRAGQRLRLPSGYRDRGPITVTPPAAPPRRIEPLPSQQAPAPEAPAVREPPREEVPPPLPSRPQPYVPSTPQRVTPPAPTPQRPSIGPPAAPVAAPPPSDAAISAMGRGRFLWPVRGDVISDFGPKAAGQRNDGINIRANTGDAVRAAAAGDVVYAGDQVPGFGNLVLIKHEDGWVTAYGHLSRVEVKMQQKIAQGQQIGQAGSSGGVSEPQVHFEVRYAPSPLDRAKPIDPTLVLPR